MNKLVAVGSLAFGVSALSEPPHVNGNTQINDENLIAYYNSMNGASWVAGYNDFFSGMTFNDARATLGTALSHISEHLNHTLPDSVYAALGDDTIPVDFDARTKWRGLIHPIRDQQQCGSCWAFSAAEVLSDRVAIATGKESPSLSPEDMVSCDKNDMGCKGGILNRAWEYLAETGIVTESCFPYTAGDGNAPTCATKCVDGETFKKTKAQQIYAINGVTNMQKEIMTNGPIQVAFMVYKSFMSYKSGVYQKHFYELLPEGGHAVKIVGWGKESGREGSTDYWLVANSWGPGWGLDGFFKIKRGSDHCGIESRGPPYAGMPAVSGSSVLV
jgi:cathepsin B